MQAGEVSSKDANEKWAKGRRKGTWFHHVSGLMATINENEGNRSLEERRRL